MNFHRKVIRYSAIAIFLVLESAIAISLCLRPGATFGLILPTVREEIYAPLHLLVTNQQE